MSVCFDNLSHYDSKMEGLIRWYRAVLYSTYSTYYVLS